MSQRNPSQILKKHTFITGSLFNEEIKKCVYIMRLNLFTAFLPILPSTGASCRLSLMLLLNAASLTLDKPQCMALASIVNGQINECFSTQTNKFRSISNQIKLTFPIGQPCRHGHLVVLTDFEMVVQLFFRASVKWIIGTSLVLCCQLWIFLVK